MWPFGILFVAYLTWRSARNNPRHFHKPLALFMMIWTFICEIYGLTNRLTWATALVQFIVMCFLIIFFAAVLWNARKAGEAPA